jgi:hypothetical protein
MVTVKTPSLPAALTLSLSTVSGDSLARERQFDGVQIDTGYIYIERKTISELMDVNRGDPSRGRRTTTVGLLNVAKEPVDFVLQTRHQTPGILSHQIVHGGCPLGWPMSRIAPILA